MIKTTIKLLFFIIHWLGEGDLNTRQLCWKHQEVLVELQGSWQLLLSCSILEINRYLIYFFHQIIKPL